MQVVFPCVCYLNNLCLWLFNLLNFLRFYVGVFAKIMLSLLVVFL